MKKFPQILVFISKFVGYFTNFEVKTKQKKIVIVPKYTRSFMQSVVSSQKLRNESSCSRILGRKALFCDSQASICTPVAPSLLISSGHSRRMGGTNFVWGGHGPGNVPPWRRACFFSGPFVSYVASRNLIVVSIMHEPSNLIVISIRLFLLIFSCIRHDPLVLVSFCKIIEFALFIRRRS